MSGEMAVEPNRSGVVFPEALFMHQTDKPFEIHRMRVTLTALGIPEGFSAPTVLEPQPSSLPSRIRLNIVDLSKNEKMTKNSTLVSLLISPLTNSWELEEPYTIVRSEGFQIAVDSLDYPNVVILDNDTLPESVAVTAVRVEVAWQGYIDVIGPPSEVR